MILRQHIKPDLTQKNPFLKWGLIEKNPTAKKEHKGKPKISATSFNMWAESPPAWISKYILKVDQEPNQAMHRGSTAEKVLYNVLMGHSKFEDIDKEAETSFRQKTTFIGKDEDREKEIKDLIGYKGRTKTYKGFIKVAYDKTTDTTNEWFIRGQTDNLRRIKLSNQMARDESKRYSPRARSHLC